MPEATFPRTPGLLGPLFKEAARGDRGMREALFLTFNVDLGFFEDRLLGTVRQTGAAVTIVADANMFDPDPRSVRAAGRSYALGLAHHGASFHPKITIVAGRDRALIGIGSGNVTLGGWHANNEVLTTIEASREHGTPRIVIDIAQFLRELPRIITISPMACEGIERTAAVLDTLVAGSETLDTGHRLVHSLRTPILQQLPAATADRLELAAPFHDELGRALSSLVDRYEPSHITLLTQSGRAVMNPDALLRAAGQCDLRFTQIDGDTAGSNRYRHGKILSALNPDDTVAWTLTGSPNLTAAALLRTADNPDDVGNCEVGIISGGGASLIPTPLQNVADTAALEHRLPPTSPTTSAGSMTASISEARKTEDGLLVVLSRPATDKVLIEVSPFLAPPENFEPLGSIGAGHDRAVFAGIYDAGTRVRAGASIQFLADFDLVQLRLRQTTGARANSNATHADLFASQALAQEWQKALTDLVLSHQRPNRTQAGNDTGAARTHEPGAWRTLDDDSAWNDYADTAEYALGLPMFLLAAGSASIRTTNIVGASLPNAGPAWEDRFEDTTDAFEEDQTAEQIDDTPATPTVTVPPPMTPSQRGYYRTWLKGLVDLMDHIGPVENIAATQLVIAGTGAQCWDGESGAKGWFDTLATAVRKLVVTEWPDRLTAQAASIAAISLYRLRLATPPDDRGREAQQLRDLTTDALELVEHADETAIEANLGLLEGARMLTPTPRDILDELRALTTTDQADALLNRLARSLPDLEAEWAAPGQLTVEGRTSNPVQTAARILDLADAHTDLAVFVENRKGQWALLADLVMIVDGRKPLTMYTTFAIGPLTAKLAIVNDDELRLRRRVSKPPFAKPGDVELNVVRQTPITALPLPDTVRAALTVCPSDSHPSRAAATLVARVVS